MPRHRVFPIEDYDGRTIPLPDASVDVVLSSNVLEHVADLSRMHAEIRRVLAPGGICIHVLPTHTWRFWTTLTSYLEAISFSAIGGAATRATCACRGASELQRLGEAWYRTARHAVGLCLPRRHGERGNVIAELWLFHPRWWRRNFRDNGFAVVAEPPMGLFYTGEVLLGVRLGIAKRARLARVLGSSCHLFKLVPVPQSERLTLPRGAHANSRAISSADQLRRELNEDLFVPAHHGVEAVFRDDRAAGGVAQAGLLREALPQPLPSRAQSGRDRWASPLHRAHRRSAARRPRRWRRPEFHRPSPRPRRLESLRRRMTAGWQCRRHCRPP